MIVPIQCSDAGLLAHVPDLDGQIGGAAGKQLPGGVKGDVIYGLHMPAEGALQSSSIEVPDLNGPVLGATDDQSIERMEDGL